MKLSGLNTLGKADNFAWLHPLWVDHLQFQDLRRRRRLITNCSIYSWPKCFFGHKAVFTEIAHLSMTTCHETSKVRSEHFTIEKMTSRTILIPCWGQLFINNMLPKNSFGTIFLIYKWRWQLVVFLDLKTIQLGRLQWGTRNRNLNLYNPFKLGNELSYLKLSSLQLSTLVSVILRFLHKILNKRTFPSIYG